MAYNITITDGTGTESVLNGAYSANATATGYDTTTLNPTSLTVATGTNAYAFTIAATGTLTLHVTEDGTSTGTPVVGATFYRTDSSGNTYGTVATTDSNGDAVLSNVPWAATGAPTVYYKQTASDGAHEYSTTVASTTLTSQDTTVEIQNAAPVSRTFTLTDANYANLNVNSATISLS